MKKTFEEESLGPQRSREMRAFSSRCSPSRLFKVIRGLSIELKEVVKDMGFGNFIGMQNCNLRRDLIQWLVERFDPIDGSINVQNRKLHLNSRIFGQTLGVRDGGEDIEYKFSEDNGKRNCCERTSLIILQQKLEQNAEPEQFVRNFTLYLVGTMLMPTTSLYVGRSLELALQEVKCGIEIRSKNWASLSWRFLVKSIRRYKERQPQFICGCIYFFQLLYFQHVEGYDRYVDKSLCPMQWWSESEIKLILKWVNKKGGFDNVNIFCTSNESNDVELPLSDKDMSRSDLLPHVNNEIGVFQSEMKFMCDGLKEYFMAELSNLRKELNVTRSGLKEFSNDHAAAIVKPIVSSQIRDVVNNDVRKLNMEVKVMCDSLKEEIAVNVCKLGKEVKAMHNHLCDEMRGEFSKLGNEVLKRLTSQNFNEWANLSAIRTSSDAYNSDVRTTKKLSDCRIKPNRVSQCEHQLNNSCSDLILRRTIGHNRSEREALLLYDAFFNSGGTVVGPFTLQSNIDVTKFCLGIYVFFPKLSLSDVLFRHKEYEVVRLYFGGLLPQAEVDIQLLGAYVLMVRCEEFLKFSGGHKCSIVCMPVRKKSGVIVDVKKIRHWQGQVPMDRCLKVIIPILDLDEGHWYMVDFNLSEKVCTIWDSLGCGQHNMTRRKIIKDLGRHLDEGLSSAPAATYTSVFPMSEFLIRNAANLPLQDNCFDCGVFLIKYIQSCVSLEKKTIHVDPLHDRLTIALDIVGSVFNEISSDVVAAAQDAFQNLYANDRMSSMTSSLMPKLQKPKINPIIPSLATKRQRTAYWSRYSRKKSPEKEE